MRATTMKMAPAAVLTAAWLLVAMLAGCSGDDAAADSGTADTGTGDSGVDANDEDAMTDAGVCPEVIAVPETVDSDLTVGPGCVRINRTIVTNDATLTIAAGTTVLMAGGGFLDVSPFGDASALVAVGTEDAPIVFTSAAAEPSAGDWQCVRLGGDATTTEIRHAVFEYGGAPCDVTGNAFEGELLINSPARAVSDSSFSHSLTHGVLIQPQGAVREFQDNHFENNTTASIEIAAPRLLVLGTGLTFADADERIDIDTGFPLETEGVWLGQPVPFRALGTLSINDEEVTMGAGLTLQLNGGSVDVFTGNLIVAGTETAPVVFTSSAAMPAKGDWGCVSFASVLGRPRFDHAIIEYAGNGVDCGAGNAFETGISATDQSPLITNTTFRNIAGSAVRSTSCDMNAAWCMNTFESVDVGPLTCGFGDVPTACL